jgi:hypothetical protein
MITHERAFRLGVAGAALGLAAGMVQIVWGTEIPEWTGNKEEPVALGALTIGLFLIAAAGAVWQRRVGLSPGAQAACAAGMIGPALLCLTTVGRLAYVPAVLLVPAGVLSVENWRGAVPAVARNWLRVLLSVLGGCELLMAAGSGPRTLIWAAAGGTALIAAAWLRSPGRVLLVVLVAASFPFADMTRDAIVPVLVMVEAAVLVWAIHHRPRSSHDVVAVH